MKTKYLLIILGGVLFFLFFLPRSLVYSENWALPFITINGTYLVIIPALVYHIVGRFRKNSDLQVLCAVASAFVCSMLFAFADVEGSRLKSEFNRTAVKTSAVVTFEEYRSTKFKGWYIQLTYHAEGATYKTEMHLDQKNRYAINYVQDLYYLKEFPNQYRVDLDHRIYGVSNRIP
jgi:hypothetical protein